MTRLFRLLACLSAFMLVLSGGICVHAAQAHDHAVATDHGHGVAQGKTDAGDAHSMDGSQLHCGGHILSLTHEYSLPLRPMASIVPKSKERAASPVALSCEPPPPRLAS